MRSFSSAKHKLNDRKASENGVHSGEMAVSEGAEILMEAMDLMKIGNRETSSTPSSVSEGLLRWSASNTSDSHLNRKKSHRGLSTSSSSCSFVGKRSERHPLQQYQQRTATELAITGRTPTTSLAPTTQDANTDSLSQTVADDPLESGHHQRQNETPATESDKQVPSDQLELLRSLTTLITRLEAKLSRVEERIAQLENQQHSRRVSRSESIDNTLISLTVPLYSATCENFDAEQRFQSSGATTSSALKAADARPANGDAVSPPLPQEERHSSNFKLQARRRSKTTLADQLWRKNSCPSHDH